MLISKKSWKNPATHYLDAMNSEWYKCICVIEDQIVHSTFDFYKHEGVCSVCLPVTSCSVTSPMGLGSDSIPVKVNIQGVETYMSDSMQFHLEYMIRILNKGVHYLMPSFRGEAADERHLCQFYHSEAEIEGSLNDVMDLIGRYITYLCKDLLNNCKNEILAIAGTVEHIKKLVELNGKYPVITYEKALKLLNNDPAYVDKTDFGIPLINRYGERVLIEKHNGIVWLINHYWKAVPFYQAKQDDTDFAKNSDLLFGIGEVVGCGERCESYTELLESLKYHEVDSYEYNWYIKMKENKPLKTSGFGMGIERFILFILKHDEIRDIQPILRFNGMSIEP